MRNIFDKSDMDKNKLISNKKSILIGISVVFIILLISIGGYISYINKLVEKWENKIYPNVMVQGINIGGMSKEEAKEILKNKFKTNIDKKKIIVVLNNTDKEFKANYSQIEPKYNIDNTINKALDYGKDLNIFKKNYLINSKNQEEHDIKMVFTYNNKKLDALENNIMEKFNLPSKNANLIISDNGSINIEPEKTGYLISKKELDKQLKEKINGNLNEETKIEIEAKEKKPKITKKDLSKINGVIGSFTSSFQSSDENRSNNIKVATEFVNGTVLMPGETFSYSKASQKDKSKYKEGNVYINNKVEKDIGGGICQVSSALYRAVMRANIRPAERHNHSLTVGYEKPGLDATVAWGYLDYKFKNPYNFPIYIQGTTHNKIISFKVYGDVKGLGGKTYDMVNEIVKEIPPIEEIVSDPSLPRGRRVVENQGQVGYVAKGYIVTYKNGKVINKELVSTDTYAMVPRKVLVGTR